MFILNLTFSTRHIGPQKELKYGLPTLYCRHENRAIHFYSALSLLKTTTTFLPVAVPGNDNTLHRVSVLPPANTFKNNLPRTKKKKHRMSREFSVFIVCLYLLTVHLSHSIHFFLFVTDLSHHSVIWQTATA